MQGRQQVNDEMGALESTAEPTLADRKRGERQTGT